MSDLGPRALPWLAGIRAYAAASLFRWSAPPQRFVVLTTPRSGSQLLVELLDAHPGIRCDSEILRRPPLAPGRYVRGRAVQVGARSQAYGFKMMVYQVIMQPWFYSSLGSFVAELRASGFRLVVLRRERQLDQALSFLAGSQIGWHQHRGDGIRVDRLAVDPASLLHALVTFEGQRTAQEEAVEGVPHLAVTYETDLHGAAAQQQTVDRICDWIGVDRAPVTTDLVRPAPGGLVDRVADPAAVAAALRTTRFAPLAAALDATGG